MSTRRVVSLLALAGCPGLPEEGTCDAYTSALADAGSCRTALECGQPVTGTSCGCTRDRVARLDADLDRLYALQADAVAADCPLDATSVCDCPEALGFDCIAGTCAFNLVEAWPYVPACPTPGDPYTLVDVALDGDSLVATVAYGGGCAEHTFGLCWNDQSFGESDPVVASLTLYHDDGGDACDAWLQEERAFSVAPLAAAWTDAYGSEHGTIRLVLDGQEVTWTF